MRNTVIVVFLINMEGESMREDDFSEYQHILVKNLTFAFFVSNEGRNDLDQSKHI